MPLRTLIDPGYLPALDPPFAIRRPGAGLGPVDPPPFPDQVTRDTHPALMPTSRRSPFRAKGSSAQTRSNDRQERDPCLSTTVRRDHDQRE